MHLSRNIDIDRAPAAVVGAIEGPISALRARIAAQVAAKGCQIGPEDFIDCQADRPPGAGERPSSPEQSHDGRCGHPQVAVRPATGKPRHSTADTVRTPATMASGLRRPWQSTCRSRGGNARRHRRLSRFQVALWLLLHVLPVASNGGTSPADVRQGSHLGQSGHIELMQEPWVTRAW